MNIIEGFKKRAREGFNSAISALQEGEEGEVSSEETLPSGRKLIEEVDCGNDPQDNYEEEQFQFFANQPSLKQPKCVVCKKTQPKYTCPKCRVKYCSSEHFKTHNLFCTEKFFKGEVEDLLKRTRMGKADQKKMVEMLRANEAELTEDSNELLSQTKVEQVTEERLNEIMAKLESGEDIQLSENEVKCFEDYLRDIEFMSLEKEGKAQDTTENEEMPLFEEYIPFWMVEEGLQQYFVIGESVSLQDYNQSEHKSLIDYRQLAAEALRKELPALSQSISFKKTSIFVVYDLVQVTYLAALLFRSFNGEDQNNPEFIDCFSNLYDQHLAKKIAETSPTNLRELAANDFPTVIPLLKTRLSLLQNEELLNVLRGWLPLIIEDASKILKNKYLCLETLYRLAEALKSAEKKVRLSLITKKLQFLLAFTNEVVFNPTQHTDKIADCLQENACQLLIEKIIRKDSLMQATLSSELKTVREKEEQEKQLRINKILLP